MFNAGPPENFNIVSYLKEDHNDEELKRKIIGAILDLLKKSPKTREISIMVVHN